MTRRLLPALAILAVTSLGACAVTPMTPEESCNLSGGAWTQTLNYDDAGNPLPATYSCVTSLAPVDPNAPVVIVVDPNHGGGDHPRPDPNHGGDHPRPSPAPKPDPHHGKDKDQK